MITTQWSQVAIDRLALGPGQLVDFVTSGQFNGEKLDMAIESGFVSGTAMYSRDAHSISLQLDTLDLDQLPDFNIDALPADADSEAVKDVTEEGKEQANGADLPHISAEIAALLFEGESLGSIGFELDTSLDAVSLTWSERCY